jgi:hypothetical protein
MDDITAFDDELHWIGTPNTKLDQEFNDEIPFWPAHPPWRRSPRLRPDARESDAGEPKAEAAR